MAWNDIELDGDDLIIHNHGKAHNIIRLSLVVWSIQCLRSLVFGFREMEQKTTNIQFVNATANI